MRKNGICLNVVSTLLLGLALLTGRLIQTFAPQLILPQLDVPEIVGLTLIALLLEVFIWPEPKRDYARLFIYGFLSYLLLPWAAGVCSGSGIIRYAVVGGTTFWIVVFLFDSALERAGVFASRWPAAMANACVFYLAAQVFRAVLL